MAIQLQRSAFVHIPKTGGRWVAKQLIENVKGAWYIGDPVYDAHVSPETELPIFAFVRHPITMLNSLWHHRARKHSNKRAKDWNWQLDHELERECGCPDIEEFFFRVSERPEIVTRYYLDFVGHYNVYTLWKVEDIGRELVSALNLYGETFNADKILENAKSKIGAANNPVNIADDIVYKILCNEKLFCEQYGYTLENFN